MVKKRNKRVTVRMISLTVLIIITSILSPCAAIGGQGDENAYKIFITSDTHYLSESLHDDSDIFNDFVSGGDGKLIGYSHEITEAFVNDTLEQKPDAVIISGDLTLNGEAKSHKDLAAMLKAITDAGIKVLVIPGNHDISNPFAREITRAGYKKTDYVSPEQFADIYEGLGYGDAVSRDVDSLSYVYKLCDGLYALMLDTSMYYSNIERNTSNMGGRLNDSTVEWLRNELERIRAEDKNARFITAMHHNLFVHHRNFELNYVIYKAEQRRGELEEMGLGMFFTGHIHIQDIMESEVNGRTLTEIVSSSLNVYPIAYGVAEVMGSEMNYRTQWVDMEAYARKNKLTDENLYDFESFAMDAFNDRGARRAEESLRQTGYSDEDIKAAVETVKMVNAYYFAGRIDEVRDKILSSRGYEILQENGLTGRYMTSVFEEGGGENNEAVIRLD